MAGTCRSGMRAVERLPGTSGPSWYHVKVMARRLQDPKIYLSHVLHLHIRIRYDVVELIEPRNCQEQTHLRQVAANTISRPIAERSRHVSHVFCCIFPTRGVEDERLRKDLRVSRRSVSASFDLYALRNEIGSYQLPG